MKYTLQNDDIAAINGIISPEFPRYTSQLMNLANGNSQGTRPRVVGQLSELFQEFMASGNDRSVESWRLWYTDKYPEAIRVATERIMEHVGRLQNALTLVNEDTVREWVEDLVFNKTFNGLYIQKAILASFAEKINSHYRLAEPNEESQGIDGYVGETAYSIKPTSYKTMARLNENINVRMIYYEKTKTALKIEVEE